MKTIKWPLLLCLFSAVALSQTSITGTLTASGSTCATAGACVTFPVNSAIGGATIQVGGTFSGTVQFEAVGADGSSYVAISDTGATPVTSTTSAGTWQFNVAGYTAIRARASALASGTVNIGISTGTASASRKGGSGGGGGAVSSVSGSGVINVSPTTGATVVALKNSASSTVTSAVGTGTGYPTFNGSAVSGDVIYTDPSTGGLADSGTALTSLAPINSPTFTTSLTSPCISDSGVLDSVSCPFNVTSGPITVGSSTALAVLSGTTGAFGGTDNATACTPTAGEWCIRGDSTSGSFKMTVNNGAEFTPAPTASPTFTGTVTLPVTGSTQCLQVNSSGVVSGTSCGATNVNGSPVTAPANFNGTTPAAGTGYTNVTWQTSGSSVSAEIKLPLNNFTLIQAICQGASGRSISGSFPAANAPAELCSAGSSTVPQDGAAVFSFGSLASTPNQFVDTKFVLPSTLVGTYNLTVAASADTATTGTAYISFQYVCVAAGTALSSATLSSAQNFSLTVPGTINEFAYATGTPTISGCSAGNTMYVRTGLVTGSGTPTTGNLDVYLATLAIQ